MNKMQPDNNSEIDLIFLGKKIKEFLINIGLIIYNIFNFFIKKKYTLITLLILGIVSGYIYDKYRFVQYKTEIIVIPNFNSTDFIYSEVQNFSSKIIQNKKDKFFLDDIINIEIEPIFDTKSFIENDQNREFLKILSENGLNFEKILEDKNILKINKLHLITITTKSTNYTSKIVDLLINDLNQSKYYIDRSRLEIENLKDTKIQLTKSIDQINLILDRLGSIGFDKATNDVNINNYDQLNLIIDLKKQYLEELLKIDTKLIESKKIIYPVNISFNNKAIPKFYFNCKFLFPLVLILGFLAYNVLALFYKKYAEISKVRNAR